MRTYYKGANTTGNFWQKHSLSIVLAIMLLLQTLYALWSGYIIWQADPVSDFWIWWTWEYNISVVADTFGVILIVLLSKRLREIGSAEDKENK